MNCPACHHPLSTSAEGGGYTLWCGYGPCQSEAANQGASALSARAAFDMLLEQVEAELESMTEEQREAILA